MAVTIVVGNSISYASPQVSDAQITGLSDSSLALTYKGSSGDDFYSIAASITDLVPSFGSQEQLYFIGSSELCITKQVTDKFTTLYGGSGIGSKIRVGDVDPGNQDITLGSQQDISFDPEILEILAIDDTSGIMVKLRANSIDVTYYTVSGNIVSLGTRYSYSRTGSGSGDVGGKKLVQVDSDGNKFLFVFSDSNNSGYPTGLVINRSGSSFTFGIQTVLDSTTCIGRLGLIKIIDDKPIVYYYKNKIIYAVVLTISGNSISPNTVEQISESGLSTSSYPSGDFIHGDYGLVTYWANSGTKSMRIVPIKQTDTILELEDEKILAIDGGYTSTTRISSEKFAISYISTDYTYTPSIILGSFESEGPIFNYSSQGNLSLYTTYETQLDLNYSGQGNLTVDILSETKVSNNFSFSGFGELDINFISLYSLILNPYYGKVDDKNCKITTNTDKTLSVSTESYNITKIK